MSIGVDVLDADHKIIVGCLNEFTEAVDLGKGALQVDSIFSILMDYVGFHFAREERVMEVCGYARLAEHREEHRFLQRRLAEMRDRYMLTPEKDFDAEVRQFLENWLYDHIMKEDLAIRSAVRGNEKPIAEALAALDS